MDENGTVLAVDLNAPMTTGRYTGTGQIKFPVINADSAAIEYYSPLVNFWETAASQYSYPTGWTSTLYDIEITAAEIKFVMQWCGIGLNAVGTVYGSVTPTDDAWYVLDFGTIPLKAMIVLVDCVAKTSNPMTVPEFVASMGGFGLGGLGTDKGHFTINQTFYTATIPPGVSACVGIGGACVDVTGPASYNIPEEASAVYCHHQVVSGFDPIRLQPIYTTVAGCHCTDTSPTA